MTISVMIVDDSLFMRNMLKNLIVPAGGNIVAEAADGNEAVSKYAQHKPGLVFLDIVMPNKNGLEALREIKTQDPNARVIMCTSVGQEKIMQESVEAGVSDFIVKPFKADDIKAVIAKFS